MKKVTFLHTLIRGAIGKEYVVKHYKNRIIITRYANMKAIVASEKQKVRRSLFKRAVKYAQEIYANPVLKVEKRRILRRPKRLFQALMKEWFRKRREKEAKAAQRIDRWRANVSEMGNMRRETRKPRVEVWLCCYTNQLLKTESLQLQELNTSLLC
jgi:hypothetical protein